MKIAVAGTGYVGLSNAILLAQHNKVVAYDINEAKVALLQQRKSPIEDVEIQDFLDHRALDLTVTTDPVLAFVDADFVIVATPTDYDSDTHSFDTRSVEAAVSSVLAVNQTALIVIKSTIPVGYTAELRRRVGYENIVFSPEFLREGRALYDNLHPSRIIIGADNPSARRFGALLQQGAVRQDVPVLYTGTEEAEAIKLFANTYLAMRISFFNELDTYAQIKALDTRQIIEGIGLDARIGNHYNNPSFGYGGYCLPKDTKQLLANYSDVPNCLIKAVVDANSIRKDFIVDAILRRQPDVVGIFRLVMKAGSDNFRESAIQYVIQQLLARGVKVVIYEPTLADAAFMGCPVEQDLDAFKSVSSLIVANRRSAVLEDVAGKVFTRDIFGVD